MRCPAGKIAIPEVPEASFDDIMIAMNKLDAVEHEIIFLVDDVSKVPAMAPESGTMIAVVEEMTAMKNEMKHLQDMVIELRQQMLYYEQKLTSGLWDSDERETIPKKPAPVSTNTKPKQQRPTMAEVVTAEVDEAAFTLVKSKRRESKKKKRKALPKGTTEGSESFQSGKTDYKVVLTYIHPDTTTDSVKEYIADKGINALDIEDKSSADWNTKRFVVKLPADSLETVMTPAFWPKNIVFNRWFDRPSRSAPKNDLVECICG